jgi:hypothetical protein
MKLSSCARHYLVTGLWSTNDFDDQPLAPFNVDDLPEAFKAQAEADFQAFMEKASHLLTPAELEDEELIGHDFWLTRNRHGAGFWDGDYENGDAITEIVHKYFPENDDELREAVA